MTGHMRWHPVALGADRITASMRLRAVKIAALEAQAAADAKLLRDLRALLPYAARRLPAAVLDCFDHQQRLIGLLPVPRPKEPPWWSPRVRIQPRRPPGRPPKRTGGPVA